jgi:hypothetical protein
MARWWFPEYGARVRPARADLAPLMGRTTDQTPIRERLRTVRPWAKRILPMGPRDTSSRNCRNSFPRVQLCDTWGVCSHAIGTNRRESGEMLSRRVNGYGAPWAQRLRSPPVGGGGSQPTQKQRRARRAGGRHRRCECAQNTTESARFSPDQLYSQKGGSRPLSRPAGCSLTRQLAPGRGERAIGIVALDDLD